MMDRIAASLEKREKITNELKALIHEAEGLLKAKDSSDDTMQQARARIESALGNARDSVGRVEESLLVRSRELAQGTNAFVQSHAWESVGIGALAGLVIGLLSGRR